MTSEMVSERAVAGEFWRGMRLGFPVVVASAPFGLLFGALSVENGFTVFEAFLMSATVYAGASQMVGIGLFGQKVAPWLIVLSILAVNFRHVLYSAAVGRHLSGWPLIQQALGYHLLTDPQYVLTEREAEERGKVGFAWYLGAGIVVYVWWRKASLARCSAASFPIPMRLASTSCCRSTSSAW